MDDNVVRERFWEARTRMKARKGFGPKGNMLGGDDFRAETGKGSAARIPDTVGNRMEFGVGAIIKLVLVGIILVGVFASLTGSYADFSGGDAEKSLEGILLLVGLAVAFVFVAPVVVGVATSE